MRKVTLKELEDIYVKNKLNNTPKTIKELVGGKVVYDKKNNTVIIYESNM